MVLKSLGKKLKSVGKKKDKKSEEPKLVEAPKRPKSEAPKGKDKPKGPSTKPVIGGHRPQKWVKPQGPQGERTPLVMGGNRAKGEQPGPEQPREWQAGAPKGERGPLTIGGNRTKGEWQGGAPKGERGPLTIGGKRGVKPTGGGTDAPTETPVTSNEGPGEQTPETPSNKYLRGGDDQGSNYNNYTTEQSGTSKYTVGTVTNYSNKYTTEGDDGASNYTVSNGLSNYNMMGTQGHIAWANSNFFSDTDTTSSNDDPEPEDGEEVVDEAGHIRFKSQGTSAYQHSDPNMKRDEKAGEKAEVKEDSNVSDSDSDSSGSGEVGGELVIAKNYLNVDDDGGYQNKYGQKSGTDDEKEAPGNKYLRGEDGGGYTNKYTQDEQKSGPGSESNSEVSSDEPSAKSEVVSGETIDEKVAEETPANKYLRGDDDEKGGTNYLHLQKPDEGGSNYLGMNKLDDDGTSNYKPNYSGLGEDGNSVNLFSSTMSSSDPISSAKESSAQLGQNMQPDVQETAKESEDEKVALMQKNLRLNTRHNNDPKEKVFSSYVEVKRLGLSKNEKNSRGWGMLPMRDSYRNRRGYDGKITKGSDRDLLKNGGPGTQYFTSRGMQLEYEARKVLASNLKSGRSTKREDTVLNFHEGKWKTADGNVADTTEVKALDYSINEFRGKLQDRVSRGEFIGLDKKLAKVQEQIQGLNNVNTQQQTMSKAGMSGRWIFVMNAGGQFFAGKSVTGVVHHSSFLAGGAVAAAGEIAISGGTMTAISNVSGHYRPGPVYLWQAVKQLEMLGVPLTGLRVDVMGVSKPFKNAAEFLGAMDPATDPDLFDGKTAIDHLNKFFQERARNKHLEQEALEKSKNEQGTDKVEGLNK